MKKTIKNLTYPVLYILWESKKHISELIVDLIVDLVCLFGVVGSLFLLITADLLNMKNLYKRAEKLLEFFGCEVEECEVEYEAK